MSTAIADERNFDDLVREGRALLPVHAPEWTNHNPSDPGITLVELLAYFSDILLYRIGRVTPAAKLQFLRLLKGASWEGWRRLDATDPDVLRDAIDDTVAELAQADCCVTARDFERLALAAAQRHAPTGRAFIAHCVADADLSGGRRCGADIRKPGHVSVVIAARDETPEADAAKLRADVRRYLLPRCLLTTRLHVVAPDDLCVAIGFGVALRAGESLPSVAQGIMAALRLRFENGDAHTAAEPGFGTTLHLSDVVKAIDDVPGVDYVEDVTVLQLSIAHRAAGRADAGVGVQIGRRSTVGVDTRIGGAAPDGARLMRDAEGMLTSVKVAPWERLRLAIAHDGLREVGDAARVEAARRGGRHG